jgi:hypothetical protein
MTNKIRTLIAMALPVLAFALAPSAAKAQSYTGNYPVAVTESKGGIAGTIPLGNVNFWPGADRQWRLRQAAQRHGHAGGL